AASMKVAGASPTTIRSRIGVLARVDREVGELDGLTKAQLEGFLATFPKASTRSTVRSYLRCYYGWSFGEGYISADPTVRLPKVKVPKSTPRPVPTGQ